VVYKKVYTNEFWDNFVGGPILDSDVRQKLLSKHKVYEYDLEDAFGDYYMVVTKSDRKSSDSLKSPDSKGVVYEIFAETESGKVMFIIGRLFPDGNLYIITAYWATEDQSTIYYQESEVLRNEK